MVKGLMLFIWITAFATNGFSQVQQDFSTDNIPQLLKSRASAVIRTMNMTIDMRTPENVVMNVKKAITVLNKNGDGRAALVLNYNKNTAIKSVRGIVYNASGIPTGKFSQTDFLDESAVSDFSLFEDDRIKRYSPSSLAYPYTIVYEYELRFKQNLIIPDWYANPYSDLSVENSSYTFICKPDDKIRVKEYNYIGNPEELRSEKSYSRTWKVTNLPAFKYEPYAPDPGKYLTHVKIAAEQFSYYGYKGTYKNWDELGRWVYNDLLKSQQTLSPAVIAEIKNLVKDAGSDKDKTKMVYEYMQKKTRYISVQVGIGGFKPFSAMDVQRLSYGDCKALVNYTQSLLNAAGIKSEYCVVEAGSMKKSLDPEFASMDQGNHIILCVPLKSDTTWLECTSQEAPFGYLGDFTDDRLVLACTETGGKVLKTPSLNTNINLLKRKAELTLDAEGNIIGKLQTEFYGSQYDNYARMIGEPYSEQLKLLKKEYDIDNIDFTNFKLIQKKTENPVTLESLELTIQSYAPRTNSRVYLIPNAFNKSGTIPEVKNRVQPVYINRGYTDEDEIIYNLPDGYVIEVKPKDRMMVSPFGSYSFTIKQEGKKLICNRRLVLNSGTYPSEKYIELMNFFSSANIDDNGKVVLKTN
ncbi:MAG TPA: DUF3857 domain-containing protein [Pedobacter sp.]|nr:DUF3857 domain-containing protein [Pedobacter sp.]